MGSEMPDDICRVCLNNDVFFDWTEVIFEFFGPSYKECYYQYTHLLEQDIDPFTKMCQTCAEILRNTYQLVEKALKSDVTLKALKKECDNVCCVCLNKNVFFDWTEAIFEFSGPSYKECYYQYTHLLQKDFDPFTQMLCQNCADVLRNAYQLVEKVLKSNETLKTLKKKTKPFAIDTAYDVDRVVFSPSNGNQNTKETGKRVINFENENSKSGMERLTNDDCANDNSEMSQVSDSTNLLKSKKVRNFMCSYCSKIFHTSSHLKKHERTHRKDRERNEICPICGLKFYDKNKLKYHIPVHDENRERTYKCEYCDKGFFSRGALNIHKRKHLGQMAKCQVCTREFYRQRELDRHMQQVHNEAPIMQIEMPKRKQAKYIVDCNYCGQQISRTGWKSHKAMHLNEPLLKCGICDKTFFRRNSIRSHIQRFHETTPKKEYDTVIIAINRKFKPRLSRLMIEQDIINI